MTDELRSAAERVIDWYDRDGSVGGIVCPIEELRKLLAEHPEDNDEPVTEEWLTSQNLWETQIVDRYERPTFVRYLRFTYRILGVGDSGCVALIQSMSGKEEIDIRLNTRRQVRDLIRALKGGE